MRILYVDIDTLRADHLGCHGYHRDTTPTIDALAARGVRFTDVHASDVPCLPSRTALTTGMLGIRNGVAGHGGTAADLARWGEGRGFFSQLASGSLPSVLLRAGFHTASISSFPLRHGATWWTAGYLESMNLMRGIGTERADQVLPGALDWLERRGRDDSWFLHVHLWDPHTPYTTPPEYGNPFAADPAPAWHTEAVRAAAWERPGPHSAQEPWGFRPDEWGEPPPRHPWDLSTEADVRKMFDGYDVGVRYADDAVGTLLAKLGELGVLDDTAVWIGSDHGEGFGELGIYADHQAADQATTHIPGILVWPGLEPQVVGGLRYHLDVAATVAELAGGRLPKHWDGLSAAEALRSGGADDGRSSLVVSQGAWTVQRGVRFGDHLYLRTFHDGFHADWPDEALYDVGADPHEQHDVLAAEPAVADRGRTLLAAWTEEQMERSLVDEDPLQTILREGGPFHTKGHLDAYLERLDATGRSRWADVLRAKGPVR